MIVPVLSKNDTIEQMVEKLREEAAECITELGSAEIDKDKVAEETLDVIQVCIGILDAFIPNAELPEHILRHNIKLMQRGWEFKDKLSIARTNKLAIDKPLLKKSIKKTREELGLTIEEMANRLGITRGSYMRTESGSKEHLDVVCYTYTKMRKMLDEQSSKR